uniref:Fe2OG dioxygenase domain-containing protein n=1 Tax=Bionectria ochroleuca TaxID=29856 RepID=A0A8H7TTI2_BIOOC
MAKLHADDWLASLSVLFQWACVAFVILAIKAGNGRHFDTLSIDEREGTIFWTVLALPMGMLAFSIPKLGVAALLTRIMNPTKQHKLAVWGLTSFCASTVVASIILVFAQCTPMRALWDLSVVDKKCIPGSVVVDFLIFSGSVSAFTDLYLALYPATVLFKLQMNIRKKIALSVALGIGSVATVIAIKKCTRLPALAEKDFTYKTSDLVLWVVGEGTTIIVASCIPLLQPLVDLIFGRRALNSSENNGYSRFPASRLGWKKRDTELGLGTGKRGERHKGTSVDDLVEVGSQDTILRTLDYVKLADHHHDGKPGQGHVSRQPHLTNRCRPIRSFAQQGALSTNIRQSSQNNSSFVSEHRSQDGGFYYCYPDFINVPRIDLSLSDHDQLLSDLRYALTEVGFLYIENHGVPTNLISDLKNALPRLFSISPESKAEVALENSPHFLGYSGDGAETTAGKSDRREQFEFATELDATWKEGLPLRERLRGPNSWPSAYPQLRPIVETYIRELTALGERFLRLVAEALFLPQGTFLPFLSDQHRLKLVHYPALEDPGAESQGVGPHKDSSGWWTFLLQASPPHIKGLQVLNKSGNWVDVPVIPGSLVVNIGQAFEVVTHGVCKATTHRVLGGSLERFSVPFFQG